MPAQVIGAGAGAALALTAAAASFASAMPRRVWLLFVVLAVLMSTRWWGRRSGFAATATGTACALLLLAVEPNGSGIVPADLATAALLGLLGTGIAVWTGPREPAPGVIDAGPDPQRAKEEFLATVSHELRTPLNAILGWTELLRAPSGAPRQVDRGLEVIERNARRQLALVEELLAAADASPSPDAWERLDLRAMLAGLVDGLERIAATARVELSLEPAAPEPSGVAEPIWVHGDPPSLRLAVRHLVENAIKFTPAGGRVRTCLRQSGDRALLFVTDTGPGIEPCRIEDVFHPFTQQDSSSARPHGGLGLGLNVSRRLIERHGGHLDLRSGESGSTFLVTLPAEPSR
jgi:signal transduction histidine kinase